MLHRLPCSRATRRQVAMSTSIAPIWVHLGPLMCGLCVAQRDGGIAASQYHAGMSNSERTKVQNAWRTGAVQVPPRCLHCCRAHVCSATPASRTMLCCDMLAFCDVLDSVFESLTSGKPPAPLLACRSAWRLLRSAWVRPPPLVLWMPSSLDTLPTAATSPKATPRLATTVVRRQWPVP